MNLFQLHSSLLTNENLFLLPNNRNEMEIKQMKRGNMLLVVKPLLFLSAIFFAISTATAEVKPAEAKHSEVKHAKIKHTEVKHSTAKAKHGACAEDRIKFCADVKRGATYKCLKAHKSELSEACQRHLKHKKGKGKGHHAAAKHSEKMSKATEGTEKKEMDMGIVDQDMHKETKRGT